MDRYRIRPLAILVSAFALASVVSPTASAAVKVVQTDADLSRRLSRMPDLRFSRSSPRGVPVIHVDDLARYQRFTGVGAAMTDSSAWLIHDRLGPGARTRLINDLFGWGGIHLNFVRLPMGASDFTSAGRPYSYFDLPRGRSDPRLLHFSIAHDEAYIIPSLRQVEAINPHVEILANPWSPPAWMKAHQAFDDRGGRGTLLFTAYKPLADYFVKFIKAYARNRIPIAAVTPENEPRAVASYPSMSFPESSEARWILDDLAPALQLAKLPTKIYGADAAWGAFFYPRALITGRATRALSGIAWHCYSGIPDVMGPVHSSDPALDELVSECAQELTPYPVPEVVIGATRNWASAVSLWNLALDPSGGPAQPPDSGCRPCKCIVTIDEHRRTVRFSLAYYQLGQVGRFVTPGAWRIRSEHFVRYFKRPSGIYGVTSGLDDAAFLDPDGRRVLVAYNNSPTPIRFAVNWHARSFSYSLAPRATVTFSWGRSG